VLGNEEGDGSGLEPNPGLFIKLTRLRLEKKLRKLNEPDCWEGMGKARALLVSIGVNLISLAGMVRKGELL
jgi:hypothetical protein